MTFLSSRIVNITIKLADIAIIVIIPLRITVFIKSLRCINKVIIANIIAVTDVVDNIPTIITNVKGNIAKGFILHSDLSLTPCFIVKENNQFSHGNTLHEAFESLQEKLYDDSTEEERILKFKEHFSDFSKKYSAKDLFIWHHVLTGSCKAGREAFCTDKGIDVDNDRFTVYEFIELTKNSYGGNIIRRLS